MGKSLELRSDFDAGKLRKLARHCRHHRQSCRLLAIASIYDGMNRKEAATVGGMDRQTLRDWVARFNANGPDGLRDRFKGKPRRKLTSSQLQELAQIVEAGPDLERDGIVRWRRVDLEALRPLPAVAYDACDKQSVKVSSLSLVRYRGNDYSVPTQYGHQQVLVRGYVHEVVIACGSEVIARHSRSWDKEDYIFDPLHYLALLEQKTNALDQAAPLVDWGLPEVFATLRRLLEARMGKKGKREFVQVLRLLETFQIGDIEAGVKSALDRGAIGFDAVKHLILCRIERRPPRLDMTVYPYLPKAHVAATSPVDYMALLSGGNR